jgi:hypothetical protein
MESTIKVQHNRILTLFWFRSCVPDIVMWIGGLSRSGDCPTRILRDQTAIFNRWLMQHSSGTTEQVTNRILSVLSWQKSAREDGVPSVLFRLIHGTLRWCTEDRTTRPTEISTIFSSSSKHLSDQMTTVMHKITGLHDIAGQGVNRITRSFCVYLTEKSVNRKCLDKDWTWSKMMNLFLEERNEISRQFAWVAAILRFGIIARSRYPLSRITIYTHHSCLFNLLNLSKLYGLTFSRQFL